MEKHIAVYVRVSSASQSTRSQEPELRQWVAAHGIDQVVRWYRDKASGKSMERSAWRDLEARARKGEVSRIVVWRIDRLGRTAAGLTSLFEELVERRVGLVSIKDGMDLDTPSGRLMANVLASVASYEREVRGERQAAGIAAAKASGKTWGGRRPGARYKVTAEVERHIRRMAGEGEPKAAIARLLGLSRPTIYAVLGD
jgi:DNA invertase Pin-like site-specific DNA recombinase